MLRDVLPTWVAAGAMVAGALTGRPRGGLPLHVGGEIRRGLVELTVGPAQVAHRDREGRGELEQTEDEPDVDVAPHLGGHERREEVGTVT